MKIGDSVLLENGQTLGTIDLIVVTPSEMQAIGVEESGIMLLPPHSDVSICQNGPCRESLCSLFLTGHRPNNSFKPTPLRGAA